jgi:hypothetical protein
MRRSLVIWITIFTLTIFAGIATAGVPTIKTAEVKNIEPEELFEIEIIVESHAVSNYTVEVTLHPRFKFAGNESDMNITGDTASITIDGIDTDVLRFEFPMMAKNDTPEGEFNIEYRVYWNGTETGFTKELVESDKVTVSIGEGGDTGPCSSSGLLVLPLLCVGVAFLIIKKENR